MTLDTTAREHQRLLEIAREYRQRGYTVTIEPDSKKLPEFLTAFRIDLLAQNAEENVVVEVRTQASLTSRPELDLVAQALDGRPSWRFELVVTNPKDHSALQFKGLDSLDIQDIRQRLQEAQQLSEQEYGEAALLLAWSATEALLRSIATTESVELAQNNPSQLIKGLFAYGLLDKEQYQLFQDSQEARNQVAHGYRGQYALANTLKQLLRVANQLLTQYTAS